MTQLNHFMKHSNRATDKNPRSCVVAGIMQGSTVREFSLDKFMPKEFMTFVTQEETKSGSF